MAWLEIFNFLHFLGLAFGLGGATLAGVISMKAEKDFELRKQLGKILSPVSKLIWIGLILLIISGIFISILVTWPINKQLLILKHILIFWILVFGIVIWRSSKKIQNLPAKNSEKKILKARKTMKIFSVINIILWYLVTLISAFV